MGATNKLTIKDIAKMCGVSPQTVSRVINGRDDVAPGTRQRVTEAIEAVGFRPSAVARSLVNKRSYTLGYITAGLNYVGASTILGGISLRCEQHGYSLLVRNLDFHSDDDLLPAIVTMMAHQAEGLVLQIPMFDSNTRRVIDQLPPHCPPIVVMKGGDDDRYSTITVDNEGGAALATRHLLALGRRHLAHVGGPSHLLESHLRLAGWRRAQAEAGVTPGPAAVQHGDWSAQSGIAAFEALLDAVPGIDGVFAANDQMALGVLHVCHRRGHKVPEEIAVIGFDGIPEGEAFTPSLSTVRQPLAELGQLAVDDLVARIDSASGSVGPVHHLVLDLELIIRDSTVGAGQSSATISSAAAVSSTAGAGTGRRPATAR